MKASELINKLQQIVAEHGDLPVGMGNTDFLCYDLLETIQAKNAKRPSQGQDYGDDDERLGSLFIGLD